MLGPCQGNHSSWYDVSCHHNSSVQGLPLERIGLAGGAPSLASASSVYPKTRSPDPSPMCRCSRWSCPLAPRLREPKALRIGQEECSVIFQWTYLDAAVALTGHLVHRLHVHPFLLTQIYSSSLGALIHSTPRLRFVWDDRQELPPRSRPRFHLQRVHYSV